MARGQQRGCIRLRGAALGIDEENDTLFTVAVDGKTFHLQVNFLAFTQFYGFLSYGPGLGSSFI